MTKRVQKTHLNWRIDPTWGIISPPNSVCAYVVDVFPESSLDPYDFVVILPELKSPKSMESLLKEVLKEFLDNGDLFEARSYTEEDVGNLCVTTPVIGFNPETSVYGALESSEYFEFFWIKPPKELTH